jgi:hypothetical protein
VTEAKLGKVALDALQQKLGELARERFGGAAIDRVELLQYGDDPEVEPGERLARVVLRAGESEEERKQAMQAFDEVHRSAVRELRRDLNQVPEIGLLEVIVGDQDADDTVPVRKVRLLPRRAAPEGAEALTPVMARLGPDDLDTVDTLITAGIAGNRADAVRWALARIRERPAYEKLRERAHEIEELKAQF